MTAVRNNRQTGAKGWRSLRWFTVPLILLALGLAGIPMADSHSVPHDPDHSLVGAMSDVAFGSQECCDEADPGHTAGTCSSSGHCVACATGNAGVLAPTLSPEARFDPHMIILPAGLASGPAGHPPKTA